MKTDMQATSIESWQKLQPELGKKQAIMLEFFKTHPFIKFTDRNLAHNLGWPINQVTPRRGELLTLDLIESSGIIYDSQTKRNANTWKYKP